MAFFNNHTITIAGVCSCVPDNLVPAERYAPVFGAEAVERFSKSTGIVSVHKALPEQTAGDLAFVAAEELLRQTGLDRAAIGALFFVTQSPDYRRPTTACVLQRRLGLSLDCAVLEINSGCSGFVYGLQTAMSMMESSDAQYGLLLLGETASKLVNPKDKSIVMMYGDAGAAILLEKTEGAKTCTLLRSDGNRFRSIILPAGGFRDMNPGHERFVCSDGIERSLYDIFMDGTAVFSFSITDVPASIQAYLAHTGSSVEDYDVFLLHQANTFILKQISRKLKFPKEKVPVSLDRFGNTGGISIPLTLCDRYGNVAGEQVKALMCGFGIGLSWGVTSAVIRTDTVYPIVETRDYYKEGKITPEML